MKINFREKKENVKLPYLIRFKTKELMTFKKFTSGFISEWTGHYVPMYGH